MMQTMRQNMKIILWILVLAFIATIVFSWGMGGFKGSGPKQGIVASINGHDVTVDRLENLIQQRYTYEQNQKGSELGEDQVKQIRTQVWDELIRDMLIQQEVQRLGIKVSDQEIAYLIQHSPPDFIRQNEYFQTDGQFDPQKWEQYLRNPAAARDLMTIEESYRSSLPNQKFINRILSLATVSDEEAWESYVDNNLKGKAKYVFFAASQSKADSSSVTEKQIQDYYYTHRDDYRIPEKRRIAYALFNLEPSREDSASVLSLAKELIQRIKGGEDFAELAKEYSDDRSGENGGDLGFFEKGRMVPEFEEAAFSAKVGEVVGPIATRFGYHIIKVTDKRKEKGVEQIRASHILLKVEPSADTRDQVRSSAEGFAEEITKTDFVTAAEIYKVKVDTTEFFEKGGFIPGIGRLLAAVDFIFARPPGSTSPVYNVRNGELIFKVLDEQKEHVQPLADVKSRILAKLLENKRLEEAGERCQAFYRTIEDPTQLSSKAHQAGLEVKETDREFRFDDYIRDVGRDPAFTSAALALSVGELSKSVKGSKGYYLIQLTEKTVPDSSQFLKEKEETRNRLLSAKQNELYAQWLETAKKKANIEDYRYLYYQDY